MNWIFKKFCAVFYSKLVRLPARGCVQSPFKRAPPVVAHDNGLVSDVVAYDKLA